MRHWVDARHDLVRRMRASPKPLLAAIHGTAVGGGPEIVLHCDVRLALGATADFREGVDAFLGRRPPVWRDRPDPGPGPTRS